MDRSERRRIAEALILGSPDPIPAARIADIIPYGKPAEARQFVDELNTEYVKQGRAFVKPFTASLEEMVWYQETVLATLRETWSHVILKEHGQRHAAFLDAVAKLTDENHP